MDYDIKIVRTTLEGKILEKVLNKELVRIADLHNELVQRLDYETKMNAKLLSQKNMLLKSENDLDAIGHKESDEYKRMFKYHLNKCQKHRKLILQFKDFKRLKIEYEIRC